MAEGSPTQNGIPMELQDEEMCKKPAAKTHEIWSLFKNRSYQSSGYYTRWQLNLDALSECVNLDADLDDFDGMTIRELLQLYLERKEKLLQMQEEQEHDLNLQEFDIFFDRYSYADGVDCRDYRNTGLFIIGYSNDQGDPDELRLLKTFSEYGYGIPIEFGDAPKNYFDGGDCEMLMFDPLIMSAMMCEQHREDARAYYYQRVMSVIRKTIASPAPKEDAFYNEKAIDLSNYPDGYVMLRDATDNCYESIARCDFYSNPRLDRNMKVLEWTKTYQEAVHRTRRRLHSFCCSVPNVLGADIMQEMISFLV